MNNREPFWYGPEVEVLEAGQVEDALVQLLESFKERTNKNLVLTGFSMTHELRAIANDYTRLAELFSSWVDVQELMPVVPGPGSRTHQPSLRTCLELFGFSPDPEAVNSFNGHNAGNDTVRASAVLLRLLTHPQGYQLQIPAPNPGNRERKPKPYCKGSGAKFKRFWYDRKPKPREVFPFIARVKILGPVGSGRSPKTLFTLFSGYHPTATGTNGQRGKRYGYVCLPDLDTLDRFVKEVHGSQVSGSGVWDVVKDYDPSVRPCTAEEFSEWQKKDQLSRLENKREERRAWRAEQALREEEDDSDELAGLITGLGFEGEGED
ncbi:hypothetical protein OQA88_11137 [Cercophora sp. LCS_1]